MRYSANITAGHGAVYNPGSTAVGLAALIAIALPYPTQRQALAPHPLRFWLEHEQPWPS